MTKFQASQRRSEQGFTLVELAIVMVIIGLLIGGILKGQELISTAKVASTVSQMKSLDAAMNTFQEKFNAYPGDILNPNTRIPSCAAAPCSTAGDGNSQITAGTTAGIGVAPTNAMEGVIAFTQLSAADLINGIDASGSSVNFGRMLPNVKAGGGMWVAYSSTATGAVGGATLLAGRHYAVLNGSAAALDATSGGFNSQAAAQIDRKMDDGVAISGATQTNGTNCANAAGVYAEAVPGGACTMYIRILN